MRPTPFDAVNVVLDDFRGKITAILGDHFKGMYVVGSLALDGVYPDHSDIDMIVVTDTNISDEQFDKLQKLHADFATSDSPFAARTEAVYVTQNALRNPPAESAQFPQIERGTALFKAPLENGWVFQCYTLREKGLTVFGADPRTLLDPIDPKAMRPAIALMAGTWREQAQTDPEWLEWVRQRENQVFVVQTLCRMLYSLATGAVASKPAALAWAKSTLDDRWSILIESSMSRQYQQEEISLQELGETVAFVQFTFERSQAESFLPS